MTTVITIGRITKDFELRKSEKSGCVYANFSLAVKEGRGSKQKTVYYECTAFGPVAELLVKAKAKKGSLVQITGELGTSEFTRNSGKLGYSLTITVHAWSYIPGSSSGQKSTGNNGENNDTGGNTQTPSQNSEVDHSEEDYDGEINLDDEDMPL